MPSGMLPRWDPGSKHRARAAVVVCLVLLVLAAAGAVSASWGFPDLASEVFGHEAIVPGQAAKGPGAGLPGPRGPAARRTSSPPPSTVLPAGLNPVTATVTVGGLGRTYDTFSPRSGTGRVPALVVLHGRRSSLGLEESRDGLLQLAQQDKAIVVYPAGYGESWNAGACCGLAQSSGVDDLTFITDLVRQLGARPDVSAVYLVGYSNGGRMAYDVVCSAPKLVSSFVVVAAVPVMACPAGPPVSLLEMVGTLDPILTYDNATPRHHINGYPEPTVTDEMASWRRRNGCGPALLTKTTKTFQLRTWSHCNGGSVVALGTYEGAGHAWPAGGGGTPSAADVLWRFLTAPRATTPVPAGSASPPAAARPLPT